MKIEFKKIDKNDDLSLIAELVVDSFKVWGFGSGNIQNLKTCLLEDGHIARNNGAIVGCYCLHIQNFEIKDQKISLNKPTGSEVVELQNIKNISKLNKTKIGHFYSLAVATSQLKNGIGHLLVQNMMEVAKAKNCKSVVLKTGTKIAWVIKWYERIRFEIFHEYNIEDQVSEVLMVKDLS